MLFRSEIESTEVDPTLAKSLVNSGYVDSKCVSPLGEMSNHVAGPLLAALVSKRLGATVLR